MNLDWLMTTTRFELEALVADLDAREASLRRVARILQRAGYLPQARPQIAASVVRDAWDRVMARSYLSNEALGQFNHTLARAGVPGFLQLSDGARRLGFTFTGPDVSVDLESLEDGERWSVTAITAWSDRMHTFVLIGTEDAATSSETHPVDPIAWICWAINGGEEPAPVWRGADEGYVRWRFGETTGKPVAA